MKKLNVNFGKIMFVLCTVAVCTVFVVTGFVLSGMRVKAAQLNPDGTSSFSNYVIKYIGTNGTDIPGTARSLIGTSGEINYDVARELVETIKSAGTRTARTNSMGQSWDLGYTESNAEDFSNLVITDETERATKSGAVFVKLFPTIANEDNAANGYLNGLSSQWFQAVYRSTGDGKDVLTLYAANGYRSSHMSYNSSYEYSKYNDDGETVSSIFGAGHLYSGSPVRHNMMRDLQKLGAKFSDDIGEWFTTPAELPGLWQSHIFQTGTNVNNNYWSAAKWETYPQQNAATHTISDTQGLGAAGWSKTSDKFTKLNGMDEVTDTAYYDIKNFISCYDDMLFLPSPYEIFYMGKNKETNTARSGLWNLCNLDRKINGNNYSMRANGAQNTMYNQFCVNSFEATVTYITMEPWYDYLTRPALHLDFGKIDAVLADLDEARQSLTEVIDLITDVRDGTRTDYVYKSDAYFLQSLSDTLGDSGSTVEMLRDAVTDGWAALEPYVPTDAGTNTDPDKKNDPDTANPNIGLDEKWWGMIIAGGTAVISVILYFVIWRREDRC